MPKTIVITGATSGVGLEAAKQLSTSEHDLVLVGRNPTKLATAAAACAGAASVRTLLCDFESQASVRELAQNLLASTPRIDVLALNAGTVFKERELSVDGIEKTFATNHLGGFLLGELVKPRLVETAAAHGSARIVITASMGHYDGTLDFDDLGFENGYAIMKAYARSKLANVMYTRHLAAELEGTGVTAYSFHPGAVRTNIWAGAPWWAKPLLAVLKLFMISSEEGGSRLVFLAVDPSVAAASGGYYDKNVEKAPARLARDEALVAKLIARSRELVGLT